MKLLLENWKKYLHESEQSSPEANQDPGMPSPEEEKFFPWLEHIKNKKGTEAHKVLKNTRLFTHIGSGQYRDVYSPVEDDKIVIKMAKNPKYADMNKKEVEASEKYSTLFPKTFSRSPDYTWISMEKVNVIDEDNEEDFEELIKINFPEIEKYMRDEKSSVYPALIDGRSDSGVAIFNHIIESLMYGGHAEGTRYPTEHASKLAQTYVVPNTSEQEQKALDTLFKFGMNNEPAYAILHRAYNELKLNPADFGTGNIGMDDRGNMRILDASYDDENL